MSALFQKDNLCRDGSDPVVRCPGVHDLVFLTGDDEDGDLYDTGLPDQPATGNLTLHHAQGLADGRRSRPARVVHHFLSEVFRVEDERTHPEPAQRPEKPPQRIEEGPHHGQGSQPEQGRQVYLVFVGGSGYEDEPTHHVRMIGGELYGHRSPDAVTNHGGPREAEVGAKGIQEATAVANAVA